MNETLALLKAAFRPGTRDRYLGQILRSRKLPPKVFVDAARSLGVATFETDYLGLYRIHLDVNGRSITTTVLEQHAFQAELFNRFADLYPDRTCAFLNVGANIGTTCLNAHAAGFGKIVAFEPVQANIALLRRNLDQIAQFADIDIRPMALGAAPGAEKIHLNPRSSGRHSLVDDFGGGTETVRVETLDAQAPDQDSVLWIDTEGYEARVLQGGRAYLREHCRALCIEVTPALLAREDLEYLDETTADLFSRAVTLSEETRRIGDIESIRAGIQTDVILLR